MLPLRGDAGADWRPVSPALVQVRRVSASAVLLPLAVACAVAAAFTWTWVAAAAVVPVSYTHLTLPTIYSV